MKSFTHYLLLLAIKLQGIKKKFGEDPIDYNSLRKQNVSNPGLYFFRGNLYRRFHIDKAEVTEIEPKDSKDDLIIFCHGGAFVYGPVSYHWTSVVKLAAQTCSTVWMINYPKAPEADIRTISSTIDKTYRAAREKYPSKNVIFVGDSVGGTLLTSLVQRLILQEQRLPSLLVLISPVMDASFTNTGIATLEKKDPILSKSGALSAKRMAAGNLDLKDPVISPLYGCFKNFPPTLLYIAENDITRPDQELAAQKMQDQNVDLEIYFGEGMPHIWPILPVMKEGKKAFNKIISAVKEVKKKPGMTGFPDEVAEE